MFQSHNMLLPTYHLNLDTCLASNFHSLNLTIILPISVRGAVSARDSIEVVGDVTGTSNADDGVVLSKFPKWVTWCDVMISLIILLALLLPLFLMMIKGNSSFIMISSSYSHLTSSYHNYEIDKIIIKILKSEKVSHYIYWSQNVTVDWYGAGQRWVIVNYLLRSPRAGSVRGNKSVKMFWVMELFGWSGPGQSWG